MYKSSSARRKCEDLDSNDAAVTNGLFAIWATGVAADRDLLTPELYTALRAHKRCQHNTTLIHSTAPSPFDLPAQTHSKGKGDYSFQPPSALSPSRTILSPLMS